MFCYFSLEIPIYKTWVANLLREYKDFLIAHHKQQKSVRKHLMNASAIFMDMEDLLPHELTFYWLESSFQKHDTTIAKRSMKGFLLGKGLIKEPDEEYRYRKIFDNYLKDCPIGFRKCVVWYYDEKFSLRKKQISNNARKPIKVRTIDNDVCFLSRMIKWVTGNYPNSKSWLDVSEEIVNQFLLSLTPANRECMRKDLYQFFKFAVRKRCIFIITMTDYKARETTRVNYVLTFKEQSRLAQKIQLEGLSFPYEALMTSLAFYHALPVRYICSILLSDLELEKSIIYMKNIPNVYLTTVDKVLLKEYLLLRNNFPNNKDRKYLFIQREQTVYYDEAIGGHFVSRRVYSFSGFNPRTLRITCLMAMSNLYGPQFLREAYGVSQTHASRFGKYEDYLLEETLNDVLNEK